MNLLNPWWFGKSVKTGISRPEYLAKLTSSLKHDRGVLLVGSRRVGKTTVFYQFIKQLLTTVASRQIVYALLDHPLLATVSLGQIAAYVRSKFLLDRGVKLYLFFDEVQYVKDWEKQAKALLDTENVKVFFSGSASSNLMLKGAYLTGRIEKIEMWPLDFGEFIEFRKVRVSQTENYKYERLAEDYLAAGGYPEYVLNPGETYFADLINSILYKDIVLAYGLRNPDLLRDLLLLLADRVGHQTTFNKLANILSLKNDTVKEYIYYLKNTFLIEELPRLAATRGKRIYSAKKFYVADNGILFNLTGKLNYGAACEQTVFRHLRQKNVRAGFYFENQREVDFVDTEKRRPILWESKYRLGIEFEGKLANYISAAKELGAGELRVINKNIETERRVKGLKIKYMPLWKMLLD